MILRHEKNPADGRLIENAFYIADDRTGERIASSSIWPEYKPALYPVRPLQVRVEFKGDLIPDKLIGATIARAHEICIDSGEFCRIYTNCTPSNQNLIDTLSPFGFEDDDGLVRMRLPLPANVVDYKAPAGCAIVYDDLIDPTERRYFLERYNELYGVNHDMAWLHEYISRPDFMRILTVSPTGLAGEVLIWRDETEDVGVIGYVQTSKRWRRCGVASYMISLACEIFEQMDLGYAETNIRMRYPHVYKLFAGMGFTQSDLLMHYPGIDVNPEDI